MFDQGTKISMMVKWIYFAVNINQVVINNQVLAKLGIVIIKRVVRSGIIGNNPKLGRNQEQKPFFFFVLPLNITPQLQPHPHIATKRRKPRK